MKHERSCARLGHRAAQLRISLEPRRVSGIACWPGYTSASCSIVKSDVAGYGILSVAAGEAHILNLCVDTKYRSLGYGEQFSWTKCSSESPERLPRLREIFLEVQALERPNALALYQARKVSRQVAESSRPTTSRTKVVRTLLCSR